MIRKYQKEDIRSIMQIWLQGNIEAHSFVEKEYWVRNYSMVESQISQAEVFVYEEKGKIKGFIGITNNYIAGIFVDKKYQSMGIGKKLLDYVKKYHSNLSLSVYKENKRAVNFYKREQFKIISEEKEETGNIEYTMEWVGGMQL